MNDPFARALPRRVWRQDEGAMIAGVCAGIAEDLDLPLPLVRLVTAVFLILPTGLAYLALTLLLRRRLPGRIAQPDRSGWSPSAAGRRSGQAAGTSRAMPIGQSWALLQHRFEMLEPRLKNIEAFVTSSDFELHRGFRRMGP